MTDEAILVRSQPGRFDTEDLAKLLHLADHARSAVADIHDRIHAATLNRAQGADDGVILTSDGTQGWRYVRHGNALAGGRRGHLRRLTATELEEATRGPQ